MGTYFCWRPSVCAVATALIVLAAAPAHSEIYEFDKRRTEVRFTYEMGPAKQHGRFNQVTGTLQFDEHAPWRSRVSATIATASLETGQPIVDDALKGSDFFNVAADPVMTFKSRSVRSTGSDTAEMTGDITVNGITKPVTLDVEFNGTEVEVAVTMGCWDECPLVITKRREDWQIPDPKELPPDQFNEVRDLIERKVRELLATL